MLRKRNPYRELERRLGYRFKHRGLLEMALTHRSYRFETGGVMVDNQRLEFLGDAVLGFLAADYLYRRFDDQAEGHLTTVRSQATSGKALEAIAETLDLGTHLRMGRGEEQSGGRTRSSNLADAMESVLGACYVDGGMRAARRLFATVFEPVLEGLGDDRWASNSKGRLQEYCQRMWKAGPVYRVVSQSGPAHDRHFITEVRLGNHVFGSGSGPNKQHSQQRAARDALKRLEKGE